MRSAIYITFKNYLGGFEYFPFVAYHDEGIDVTETGQTEVNLFPGWPESYGEFATTITKQTFRKAKTTFLCRSQYVSEARLHALKYVRVSPLVQILSDRYTARTIIIDDNSFTVRRGADKFFSVSFNFTYTDHLPSQ